MDPKLSGVRSLITRRSKTFAQYQSNVPISAYEDFTPFIERILRGEKNVLWPGRTKWFAKSSGTTSDKSKYIPVSEDTLVNCHYRGGKDLLSLYMHNNPNSNLFKGKGLIMGGSQSIKEESDAFTGDLSAVLIQNLATIGKYLNTPDLSISLMDKWDEKIDLMARTTKDVDVTNISGVPTWTMVLIHKLFELTGKADLKEIWPNLELYIHGGVNFEPYRDQFKALIKDLNMHYREVYNASEGFFAYQNDGGSNDLLLFIDNDMLYEFIKMEDVNQDHPKAYTLNEVEAGVDYALVISNSSGLWRYMVGDTVQFTSLRPFKIKVSGRTKHFINAFGEELIIDNADNAISKACKMTNSSIKEYTAAPVYLNGDKQGCHQWLIEFENEPASIDEFSSVLDDCLKEVNSDYEAKRFKDMALVKPRITQAKKGLFIDWLRSKGKLGGQNKVPKLSNDRKIMDSILAFNSVEEVDSDSYIY